MCQVKDRGHFRCVLPSVHTPELWNVRVFYRFVMAELYMNHLPLVAGRSCDPNWVVTLGQGQRSMGTNELFFLFVRIFECDGLD